MWPCAVCERANHYGGAGDAERGGGHDLWGFAALPPQGMIHLLVLSGSDLLHEVRHCLALRDLEALSGKEGGGLPNGSMEHHHTCDAAQIRVFSRANQGWP